MRDIVETYENQQEQPIRIATWFMEQNFEELEREYCSKSERREIKRESAMAYLIEFTTEVGVFEKWVPKSMTDRSGRVYDKLGNEIEYI